MKIITINVSEPIYNDFKAFARERDRSTSELIREAMEAYRDARIRPRPSLRDLRPVSLGAVTREAITADDDLLDEMLNG